MLDTTAQTESVMDRILREMAEKAEVECAANRRERAVKSKNIFRRYENWSFGHGALSCPKVAWFRAAMRMREAHYAKLMGWDAELAQALRLAMMERKSAKYHEARVAREAA